MNSAFVVYEELSRSIRVTKTSEMFAIFFFTTQTTQPRPHVFSVTVP